MRAVVVLRFYEDLSEAEPRRFSAARIGGTSLSFPWTPTDIAVDFRIFCTLPGNASAQDVGAVVLRLDGKLIATRACANVPDPLPGERIGLALQGLGLKTGRTVQLTTTVVDGNGRPLQADDLVAGAAVYTTGGTNEHYSAAVSDTIRFHGVAYRLDGCSINPASTDPLNSELNVDGPAFEPYVVVFGIVGSRSHTFSSWPEPPAAASRPATCSSPATYSTSSRS